jgi:hypothetical protein
MKPIFVCCAFVVLALFPFAAHADLIDTIRVGVAACPELSSVAVEILGKIRKGANPDEQDRLSRQWDTAYKEAIDAKTIRDRPAAKENQPTAMRAAVLAACIKLRQRKVYTGFLPADDGTSLQFFDRGYGAYKLTQFEYKAVPDDPSNGKWTVSYPKFVVVQAGSPESPGYRFVKQTTATCTVTEDQLVGHLANESGVVVPWAHD